MSRKICSYLIFEYILAVNPHNFVHSYTHSLGRYEYHCSHFSTFDNTHAWDTQSIEWTNETEL